MRIDDRVESLVRATFDAAVKRNPEKLAASVRSFPDDQAAAKGVELSIAVTAFVLYDVYEGKPTDEQVDYVAQELGKTEEWSGFSAGQIRSYLRCVMAGRPLGDVMSADDALILSFVVPAALLSAFRESKVKWWDYLDVAEAAIESAP